MIWIAAGASYAVTIFLLLRSFHFGALEDEAAREFKTYYKALIYYRRRHSCVHLAGLASLLTLFLVALGILT
jgi:hypothetical protein